MELLTGIGWLLKVYVRVTGTFGVIGLVLTALVVFAVLLWSFRQVTGVLGKLIGVRDFKWSEWRITHPTSWRWMRAAGAVATFVASARMMIASPSIGIPLVLLTVSGSWIAVQSATFWSGYPLSWEGLVAAAQTAVTKQALDLVWQSIGVVSVQRGKLRLPRYESWSQAATVDGWSFGLHCNGFIPPQGAGGLGQIMELCASPGSEYDAITSNLNNVLLDPGELRGPLVTLLRYTGRLPLYAGTTVDRPDGYPQGVGRLTLMLRLPLERVRRYPWRPGWWARSKRWPAWPRRRNKTAAGCSAAAVGDNLIVPPHPTGTEPRGRRVNPCRPSFLRLAGVADTARPRGGWCRGAGRAACPATLRPGSVGGSDGARLR